MLRIVAVSVIFHFLNPRLTCANSTETTDNTPDNNVGFNPKTSEELVQAILDSRPGNIIELLPIAYEGNFELVDSKSVTIRGTGKGDDGTTIISTGTAFNILGNNWGIENIQIQGALIGVNINGNKNRLSLKTWDDVGKGVVIAGDENVITNSRIGSAELGVNITGNRNQIDNSAIVNSTIGITIDGDNNHVKMSTIQTETMGVHVMRGKGNKIQSCSFKISTTSLTISSDTSGGSVVASSFRGEVNIFGNGYTITSNSVTGATNIQSCKNIISKNSMKNANIDKKCNQVHKSNYFG